jgi:DnaK suppressor protein
MAKKTVKKPAAKTAAREAKGKKAKLPVKKSAPVRTAKPAGKKGGDAKKDEGRDRSGQRSYPKEELQRFKELILEKRKETMEELDTLKESIMDVTTGEYISESSNYSLHMEQGTDAMEREKTFLFASRGSKFVTQLDDALIRIDAGTYGVCRVCGLLVPKERLEAVPTAQTCAEYKNTGVPCERGRLALQRAKQGK